MNRRSRRVFQLIHKYWPWLQVSMHNTDSMPTDGPALLFPHHQRALDIVICTLCIAIEILYMAKAELFNISLLGWYMRRCGAFPVNRDKPDRAAVRKATALLDEGRVVCVFGEGKRRPGDEVFKIKPGVLMIAGNAKGDVPIFPIGICYRKSGWKLRVGFFVGQPFRLEELGSDDRKAMLVEVQRKVQEAQDGAVRLVA